jgi:hypothetical protein
MNPTHRDTDGSAGLHLFHKLSTLGPQLTHTSFCFAKLICGALILKLVVDPFRRPC